MTPNRQRATAIRLAYANAAVRRGRSTWQSPDVLTWSGWLEREWTRQPPPARRLLRGPEEWLLWREVGVEVAREADPLFRDSMTEGLRRAAGMLAEWEIPSAALRGFPGSETPLLSLAIGALERRCGELGVMAAAELPACLAKRGLPARNLQFAGFGPLAPAQRRIGAIVGGDGSAAGLLARPHQRARTLAATALDPDHELDLVAEWAWRQLCADPGRRLLVVLPDLAERGPQMARALRARLAPEHVVGCGASGETPPFAVEGGQPLARYPLVGHALDSLTLCIDSLEFDRVSHWLRAPFWDAPDAAVRSRIDLRLRAGGRTMLDARALIEELSAAKPAVETGTGRLCERLRSMLAALGDRNATPRAWSERFRAALEALRWPGLAALSSAEQQLRLRFIELLGEFGDIGFAAHNLAAREALSLLGDLARRVAFEPATGDAAVTITDATADPVVAYDGIWVAGLQAEAWPAPVRPDPFVPLTLQRAAGIPQSTPAGQLALARAAICDWQGRTGELVLSHAHRIDDAHALPSPLLAELGASTYEPVARLSSLAERLRTEPTMEEIADERGPPWALERALPSGTRALELQNLCAFRAFAELRLGAAPLEHPQHGVDKRRRGRFLHLALEKLWVELEGSAGLAARPAAALAPLIERCVREAGAQTLRDGAPGHSAHATARELQRAIRLIAQLCELERERARFRVLALESERRVEVLGARLDLRLDRLDELEDGSRVILDYKSGRGGSQRWQEEPVSHPQLLAYLLAVQGEIAAMATVHLAQGGIEFRGVAAAADLLPKVGGGGRAGNARSDLPWPAQLERWRDIGRRLVGDFIAGNAAVEPFADACELCHLHVLCRIADQGSSRLAALDEQAGDD